jgi:hypothetical protein
MSYNPTSDHLGFNSSTVTSTTATVANWDKQFISASCSTSNITLTLPQSQSNVNNGSIVIRKSDSTNYQVIIQGSGGNTINGQSQYVLYLQGECVWLVNDGSGDIKILQLNNKYSYQRGGDQKDWKLNIYVTQSPSGDTNSLNPSTMLGTSNLVDCTVGNNTISLSAQGVNFNAGSVRFMKYDSTANTATITPASGVTINGSTTPIVLKTKYSFIELHYAATNTWLVVSGIPFVGGTLQGTLDSSGFVMKAANAIDTSSTSKDVVNYGTLVGLLASYSTNAITALTGDVTASGPGSAVATVAAVGGKTASQVATAVTTVSNSTSANTVNTLVLRDSSGNFNAGSISANSVNLSGNATLSSQAPTWGQVQTYVSQSRVVVKSVSTIATTNQNVSSTSYIGATVNGRVLVLGDRIALTANTTATENGIYIVQSGGGIARSTECATGVDGNGFVFGVLYGTFANYFYRISPLSPATTAIFGTDTPTYDLYFIVQNLTVDNTTITLTGNTLSVTSGGIGTTQLAPYTNGGRVMGTNSSSKKPEEMSVTQAQLSQLLVGSQSAVSVANYGSDTLGNGTSIPYLTLTTALNTLTGASTIRMLGGYGATGTYSPTVDNLLIEGIGCDGSQTSNITGSITSASGRTRLKLKNLQLIGTSANPTPLVIASGNLGRHYLQNISFIPYSTNPSININTAVTNWMEFDDCDFLNTVVIGGSVGTGEAYTFRRARGAIYLVLTKNVPVTFVDCDAVFVVSHTAGQIMVYGRTTVNISSTATLASGAFIYVEGGSTYNTQTQTWGSIVSACTTQLVNVSRKIANDTIAALTVNTTPVTPSTASSGFYVSGVDGGGSLLYTALPAAASQDTGKLSYKTVTSAYTVLATDSNIAVNGGGGSFTITLPAISSIIGGSYPTSGVDKCFIFTKIDSSLNPVTISTVGSDNITDNTSGTSLVLNNKGDAVVFRCVGNGTSGTWLTQSKRVINTETGTLSYYGSVSSSLALPSWGSFVTATLTTANVTITLPSPTNQQGTVRIHRADSTSNVLTIAPPSGNTINGSVGSVTIPSLYTGVFEISSIVQTDITGAVLNPSAVSPMTGATASVAGTGGLVPVPQQYANNFFLRGDGTFAPLLSLWVANTTYPTGACVSQTPIGGTGYTIFQRTASAGSSSVWDATEQAKWNLLGASVATSDLGIPKSKTITNANSPYPVLLADSVINIDASSGSVLLTLPPVSSITTSSLTKRYTFNRVDTTGNSVQITANSGTTDQFIRFPSGYNTHFLDIAGSIEIMPVTKTGGNYWTILDSTDFIYQKIPYDNMLTASTILTYHGKMFTVSASSDITITLPNSAWGAGSTKIYRRDSNTQYRVTIVPPSGHTVNGQSSILLPINSTITARTVSINNTELQAELVTQNSTMIPQYGCIYGFTGGSLSVPTNTYVKAIFSPSNQTVYDPSNMLDTANPTRFYAKVGGTYELIGRYVMYGSTGLSGCGFWKNGALIHAQDMQYCSSASVWKSDSMFKTMTLAAGDYVEFIVTSDTPLTLLNCDVEMRLAINSIGSGNAPGAICNLTCVPTQNTSNIIQFSSSNTSLTKYDPMGMHSGTTNNTRITAQSAGVYRVTGQITTNYSATLAGYAYVQIYKNGTPTSLIGYGSNGGGVVQSTVNGDIALAVGDYLELYAGTANVNVAPIQLASFSATLGQGVPTNLPSIGLPNQVLSVNSSGTGLSYNYAATYLQPGAICQLSMINTGIPTNTGFIYQFPSSAPSYTSYDPMGMHSGTVNPSRITIQVAGVYEVYAYFKLVDWTALVSTGCRILKNGVAVSDNWEPASTYGQVTNKHIWYVQCNVGDYLEMQGVIGGVVGGDGSTHAAFGVKLGQGIPNNLPNLGSAGQVLAVNSTATGLQYVSVPAVPTSYGSIVGRRQSTTQNLVNANGTVVLFDTVDTDTDFNSSSNGVTYSAGTFTNSTASTISLHVSWMITWGAINTTGGRYAWLQLGSNGTRLGLTNILPMSGDGTVLSGATNLILPAGGTFTIMAYHTGGTTLSIGGAGVGQPAGYANRVQVMRLY